MGAEIIDNVGGIVTLRISGQLTQAELAAVQRKIGTLIQHRGKVRALVLVENFKGWAKDGDWGDLSFQLEHDQDIERMALVGDRKWEELAAVFMGKGLRPFPIEFFQPADTAKARAWLKEAR
jgi:hypothetical protein